MTSLVLESTVRASQGIPVAPPRSPITLATVEAHVATLFQKMGPPPDEDASLADEASPSFSDIRTNAARLDTASIRLPEHIRTAARQVTTNPLQAFLKAIFDTCISPIIAIITKIVAFIKHAISSLFSNKKALESQELSRILTTLKHKELLTTNDVIAIQKAHHDGNKEPIERILTELVGNLTSANNHTEILGLALTQGHLQAFRYIHTLVLLSELNSQEAEWRDFVTTEQKCELKDAFEEFRTSKSIEKLHNYVYDLFLRLHTKNWLTRLQQHESLRGVAEVGPLFTRAHQALAANNEAHFGELCVQIVRHVDPTKLTRLEQLFFQEVGQSLGSGDAIFKKIALHHSHERFLGIYNQHQNRLLEMLETREVQQQLENNTEASQRLERLMNRCMALYSHYGAMLDNEEVHALSATHFAAQYGSSVATWRKINDIFVRFQRGASHTCGHATCSCLYGDNTDNTDSTDRANSADRPRRARGFAQWKLPNNFKKQLFSAAPLNPPALTEANRRLSTKSVLFLPVGAGGGHFSAANALIQYTQQAPEHRYHVRSINLTGETLLPIDPFAKIFSGLNIEVVHNWLMQHDLCNIWAWMRGLGGSLTEESKNEQKRLIRRAFLKERPDLIMLNNTAYIVSVTEVAEELGIPIIHTATDYDISGLDGLQRIPRHFKTTIPAATPQMLQSLNRDAAFQQDHVEVTGPALRAPFIRFMRMSAEEKAVETRRIRAKYGIAEDEQVLLFSSGSVGLKSPIPKILAEWQNAPCKIRLICICGSNTSYRNTLDALKRRIGDNGRVRLDIHGTASGEETAEMLHIAHAFVGKPGGLSTAEALQMGCRFIGDQTGFRATWERFNNNVAVAADRGAIIRSSDEVIATIERELAKPRPNTPFVPNDTVGHYQRLMNDEIRLAENDAEYQGRRQQWVTV